MIVLTLDLIVLLVAIWFAIILALYRTFKPPPLKNVHGEVAMVKVYLFLINFI
jgi:nitrogen fixation/metabolism regulation signal transduction histidine kinase